jgi:threonine/homoserine/homoserine lactone efflux protein
MISFLGSLPLGTLNITAFQISGSQNVREALIFSIAAILVELAIVRISLTFSHKLKVESKWLNYILPLTFALLFYLAYSNFISLNNDETYEPGSKLFPMIKSSFFLGLVLSVLNPMHLPFWTGWNSVLIAKDRLNNNRWMYSSYIFGICLGSIAGFLVFILAGKFVFQNYQNYNYLISFVMGCIYLGFSIYVLFLLVKRNLNTAKQIIKLK